MMTDREMRLVLLLKDIRDTLNAIPRASVPYPHQFKFKDTYEICSAIEQMIHGGTW
jgi:hypothetical protein